MFLPGWGEDDHVVDNDMRQEHTSIWIEAQSTPCGEADGVQSVGRERCRVIDSQVTFLALLRRLTERCAIFLRIYQVKRLQ